MRIEEAIIYKNNQNVKTFKVSKNWVVAKSDTEKRFKDFSSIESFIEDTEIEINNNNAYLNSRKVVEYVLSLGLEADYKSIYGSVYFHTPKGTLRVSNHAYTSEKHLEPKLNVCSYKESGYLDMIKDINEFLK